MRNHFLLVVCLIFNVAAQAQFTDSTTRYFRFSATGNLNRSNSSSAFLFNNDARFSVRNKRTTFNTVAGWLYGEQGSELTNNDFTSTSDFNWYRDSSAIYYWALVNYTTSYSLKINNQLQAGLGAAYNFVNTADTWLNLSEGILYETSSLNTDKQENNRYHTFRNSLRLSYNFLIGQSLSLKGANYFQQAIGDGSDYIFRTSNSLQFKLNKWISLGSTISYNQFRRTGTENLLFTYGIVAEKYF